MKEEKTIQKIVANLLATTNTRAVIFDLDGTLIDNNSFHLLAWKEYLKKAGFEVGAEEYRKNINGRTNKDAIEYIFKRKMTDEEVMMYALEKEAVYRDIYLTSIKPVEGLIPLLETFHECKIPMAIATSGIQVNIDFMFEHIPIKQYFKTIMNSAHISKGKPDPEIYLKTAAGLDIPPGNCLVFEDAAVGVAAAKSAGMKVIALTTTQLPAELMGADMIIRNYNPESFPIIDSFEIM